MRYSHTDYWRDLHQRSDLSSVGQSGLPGDVNKWIYRTHRRNLTRFARQHGLTSDGTGRVLEVGVGTGYWIDMWQSLGWQVDGCDLVGAAVERLCAQRPGMRVWQADVSDPAGLFAHTDVPGEGYDLVTATNVLLHVTEPDAFKQALANVAAAVKVGGHLLLVEPALLTKERQPRFDPELTSRARVLKSYLRPLRAQGMELVTVEAATVLASNPIEATSRRKLRTYRKWWARLSKSRQNPKVARWLGPTMYVMDGLLLRTSEAPTSKALLFRRAS